MINKFVKIFLSVFLPKVCVICKSYICYNSDSPICDKCFSKIKFIKGLVCLKCGLPLKSGGSLCYSCKNPNRKIYFDNIRSVCEYEGVIKILIKEFKYNKKIYLKKFFINILKEWFLKNFSNYCKIDFVCCVPMHFIKQFWRGYNQAELLADEFSKNLNLNFHPNILKRKKFTVSQFKLPKQKRIANVSKAFELNDNFKQYVKNKNILLIDDICTTSETINQCCEVLKKNKAKNVFGLTIARDI